MSYPKDVTRFMAWAKAMVAGATVDKPNYGKTLRGSQKRRFKSKTRRPRRRRWRLRRSKRKKDA